MLCKFACWSSCIKLKVVKIVTVNFILLDLMLYEEKYFRWISRNRGNRTRLNSTVDLKSDHLWASTITVTEPFDFSQFTNAFLIDVEGPRPAFLVQCSVLHNFVKFQFNSNSLEEGHLNKHQWTSCIWQKWVDTI